MYANIGIREALYLWLSKFIFPCKCMMLFFKEECALHRLLKEVGDVVVKL